MTRTTLVLDEDRFAALKRLAAERGQTLSALVDEFLADGLRQATAPRRKRKAFKLPAYRMGQSAVDLANRERLYDVLDHS